MPLSSYLTRLLRWLRAGYPTGAPSHGHIPLIALMPSPAVQLEDLLHTGELPPLHHPAPGRRCAAATNLTKTATPVGPGTTASAPSRLSLSVVAPADAPGMTIE